MLNIHPALFLSGVSEPEKTSRKSPWILVEKEMNQRPVAKAEMGKKARGGPGLPLGGVYSGTNKEEKAFALLCGARRSTFTVLSHNANYACFNVTLAVSMHTVNFNAATDVHRTTQAEPWVQQLKTEEKYTPITGIQYQTYPQSYQSLHNVTPSFSPI